MGRKKEYGILSDKIPHGFVRMPWDVLKGKAYIALPPTAAKLLPYFFGQVQYVPYNSPTRYNTSFDFTYSEAKRYGIAKATFHDALADLIEVGFIDPVSQGGLRGYGRSSSIFKLSRRWEDYGTASFKTVSWRPSFKKQKQLREQALLEDDHQIGERGEGESEN
jgi:hypothetical protein